MLTQEELQALVIERWQQGRLNCALCDKAFKDGDLVNYMGTHSSGVGKFKSGMLRMLKQGDLFHPNCEELS